MGMKFRKVSIEDALKGVTQNNWKFSGERNTMYNLYFPPKSTIEAKIHEWEASGKYGSAACSGDPSCLFCAVEKAGWEEYNAKVEAAIAGLDPTNPADQTEIKKRKKALVPKITSQKKVYQLVAVISNKDGAETYEFKIMCLTQVRLQKFQEYAKDSGHETGLDGFSMKLKYPDVENPRDRGRDVTFFPGPQISDALKGQIEEAAEAFNWEAAMGAFYEFRDLSQEDAKRAIASVGYEVVDDDDDEEVPFAAEPAAKSEPVETKAAPAAKAAPVEKKAEPAPAVTTADDGDGDDLDDLEDLT